MAIRWELKEQSLSYVTDPPNKSDVAYMEFLKASSCFFLSSRLELLARACCDPESAKPLAWTQHFTKTNPDIN